MQIDGPATPEYTPGESCKWTPTSSPPAPPSVEEPRPQQEPQSLGGLSRLQSLRKEGKGRVPSAAPPQQAAPKARPQQPQSQPPSPSSRVARRPLGMRSHPYRDHLHAPSRPQAHSGGGGFRQTRPRSARVAEEWGCGEESAWYHEDEVPYHNLEECEGWGPPSYFGPARPQRGMGYEVEPLRRPPMGMGGLRHGAFRSHPRRLPVELLAPCEADPYDHYPMVRRTPVPRHAPIGAWEYDEPPPLSPQPHRPPSQVSGGICLFKETLEGGTNTTHVLTCRYRDSTVWFIPKTPIRGPTMESTERKGAIEAFVSATGIQEASIEFDEAPFLHSYLPRQNGGQKFVKVWPAMLTGEGGIPPDTDRHCFRWEDVEAPISPFVSHLLDSFWSKESEEQA